MCPGNCINKIFDVNSAFFSYNELVMKTRLTLILTLLFSITFVHPGFADDSSIPYPARVPLRIVRGVTNIALGWTEILLRPIGEHKTESIPEAFGIGFANATTRTTLGGREIFMCWVPDLQMEDAYPDWQTWPYLFHWS